MIFIVGGCFLAFFLIGYRTGMEDNRIKQCDFRFREEDLAETKRNFINDGVVFLEKGQLFSEEKLRMREFKGTILG